MNQLMRLPAVRSAVARAAVASLVATVGVVAVAVGLATGLARLAGHAAGDPVAAFLVAAAGLVLRAGAGLVGDAMAGRDARRVVAGMRGELLHRLVGDPDTVAVSGGVGPAAVLVATRLTAAVDALATALSARAQAATVPLVVLVALAIIDWPSAVVVAVCTPLVPLFMVLVGRYTRDETVATVRALNRVSTHIAELVRGLPVLVGLGRAAQRFAQLRRLSTENRRQAMTALRTAFLSAVVLELLATLAMALVAVTAGVRLVSGSIPLASGLAALLLAPEVFAALRMLGAAYHSADDAVEALTRTTELVRQPAAATVRSSSTGDNGPLVLAGLDVHHAGRATAAVSSFTATIPAGEVVRLTGPSGAGKSTVLDVLAGRLRSGRGVDVTGTVTGGPVPVGHVPQHPRCAADTVAEELRLHGADPDEVARLLGEVGLPAGIAGRRCADLSPGELQLVALARALVQVHSGDGGVSGTGAGLLLLDEPTAHVDADRAARVAQVVARHRGKLTTLVATHDPALAAVADREVALR